MPISGSKKGENGGDVMNGMQKIVIKHHNKCVGSKQRNDVLSAALQEPETLFACCKQIVCMHVVGISTVTSMNREANEN